jgi:hypothetical protein
MVTMSSSTLLSQAAPAHPKTVDLPLLNAVLEGFVDGILVLTEDGTCVHSNREGQILCRELAKAERPAAAGAGLTLPHCLKTLCSYLLDSCAVYGEMPVVLTEEFVSPAGNKIRARIQWLDLPGAPDPCLLVSLENKTRSACASAQLEAIQYNLTPRERAVWMLRRANRTYDEIAQELYITVNTVKRHLKSIYAKRKEVTEAMVN